MLSWRQSAIQVVGVVAIVSACQSASFKSADKGKGSEAANPSPTDTTNTNNPDATNTTPDSTKTAAKDPACTAAGITSVTLDNDSITNGAANQFLTYSLSIKNCEGVTLPLPAGKVLFDIDALDEGSYLGTYKFCFLLDGAKEPETKNCGEFQVQQGQDLFGVKSPGYYYFQADLPSGMSPGTKAVKIRMDLSNSYRHPLADYTPDFVLPDAEKIPTYLKVGDANAVEQKVSFLNSDASKQHFADHNTGIN